MKPVSRYVSATFAGLVVLIGCNQGSSRREVVVYVSVDRKDSEPILRQFEQQSGIRVRAIYDAEAAKTTGLVTRLIAESQRPRCDVFWNNEVVQTLLLNERGLLQPYHSPGADGVPKCMRDPAGCWTSIGSRMRVIVYNTKLVDRSDVPRTLAELCDARWKGKVAVANPQFGTTRTHIAALHAGWGASRTQDWLRCLLENEVRIVDGNAMVKNLVARADPHASPILLGLTDTDDVRSGQQQGEPVDFVYPDQAGEGTLVVPTTVCIIRDAPHLIAARELIDFLVSPTVETALTAEGTGYAPIRFDSDTLDQQLRSFDIPYSTLLDHLAATTSRTSQYFHH